jgi:hypothetical protein
MRKFEPMDVVAYDYLGNHCDAIVRLHTPGRLYVHWARRPDLSAEGQVYRDAGGIRLDDGEITNLRLHPDPDPILAHYCARVLIGEDE